MPAGLFCLQKLYGTVQLPEDRPFYSRHLLAQILFASAVKNMYHSTRTCITLDERTTQYDVSLCVVFTRPKASAVRARSIVSQTEGREQAGRDYKYFFLPGQIPSVPFPGFTSTGTTPISHPSQKTLPGNCMSEGWYSLVQVCRGQTGQLALLAGVFPHCTVTECENKHSNIDGFETPISLTKRIRKSICAFFQQTRAERPLSQNEPVNPCYFLDQVCVRRSLFLEVAVIEL
ncbi:hypothetical protein EDB86DRAFT_449685 [Lactarius hatsudake]|nr:hypothetical protein EDB86DRAFT_449685 [Lactarius hatsudake]